MVQITALPAFTDNYLWLLDDGRHATVVDPGDAAPVEAALAARGLELSAILITHWHPDHIGGLAHLTRDRRIPVYGPRAEEKRIAGLTERLDGGERIILPGLNLELEVFAVPGHTLGHIAYFQGGQPPRLFCGDTLFSAGCGRLFEGTPAQMHDSLAKIDALPAETEIYCTHEYTLSNLAFATAVEPGNTDIHTYKELVQKLRQAQQPSLPSRLALERRVNPFLRVREAAIISAASARTGRELREPVEVFAALRAWKDKF